MKPEIPQSENEYTSCTVEKLRYCETDRQGHINNTVFFILLEAGRVKVLFESGHVLNGPGTEFVLAQSSVNFVGQLHWPGEVLVATRVEKLGSSSITLSQALFQKGVCAATASSVMVLMDVEKAAATPLPDQARSFLETLMAKPL